MQRTLQIFINDLFYKEITVEADAQGSYSLGPIFAMINQEREDGLLADFIQPSDQLAIRLQMNLLK